MWGDGHEIDGSRCSTALDSAFHLTVWPSKHANYLLPPTLLFGTNKSLLSILPHLMATKRTRRFQQNTPIEVIIACIVNGRRTPVPIVDTEVAFFYPSRSLSLTSPQSHSSMCASVVHPNHASITCSDESRTCATDTILTDLTTVTIFFAITLQKN